MDWSIVSVDEWISMAMEGFELERQLASATGEFYNNIPFA
jgi:hypothetical protein